VRKEGGNESEDLTLAARNALLNMIDHLGTLGFDRQQAYALCSVAVDLRIGQTVDVPNVLVTALLPLEIFV
jgi:formamidase